MLKFRIPDIGLRIAISLIAFAAATAQEPSLPTETASPAAEQTPSSSPTPSPLPSTARNVALRFVPPPMEGTITLGVFDSNDKLVCLLHRAAKVDTVRIDDHALIGPWAGNDSVSEVVP